MESLFTTWRSTDQAVKLEGTCLIEEQSLLRTSATMMKVNKAPKLFVSVDKSLISSHSAK